MIDRIADEDGSKLGVDWQVLSKTLRRRDDSGLNVTIYGTCERRELCECWILSTRVAGLICAFTEALCNTVKEYAKR